MNRKREKDKWDDLLSTLGEIAEYMGYANEKILKDRIKTDNLPIVRANGGRGRYETTKRALHMWSLNRFGILDILRTAFPVTQMNEEALRRMDSAVETVNLSMKR